MKKILDKIIITIFFTVILGIVMGIILGIFNLQYRMRIIATLVTLALVLIISVVYKVAHTISKKKQIWLSVLGVLMKLAIVPLILISLVISSFAYMFCSEEHVVDSYGEKMVTRLNAFLDVYVYYYPYKNWFVMEKKEKMVEWYGSGGYDPFKRNPIPEPIDVTYK